jgi:hypothetical protein
MGVAMKSTKVIPIRTADDAADIDIKRPKQEEACDPPTSQPPSTKRSRRPVARKVEIGRALEVAARFAPQWRVRITCGDILIEPVNMQDADSGDKEMTPEKLRDLL